jgi:hypothetical protein
VSIPSSAKAPRNTAPLVPDAVTAFLARMVLAGFVVALLALTGHA